MNKLLFTLAIIFQCLTTYAQKGVGNEIHLAIERVTQQVESIDNEIRFKTIVDYSGYRTGNDNEINEWLAVLYFNDKQSIVKSKLLFSFPEESGSYYRYYDTNGVSIYSLYSTFSEMNYSFSISRYLKTDKSLLYVDLLRRDDDRGGIIIEHTCRSGGNDLEIPKIDGVIYDEVIDIISLEDEIINLFKVDSLYVPQYVDTVRFIKARKGDRTFITHNRVPVYKTKSENQKPFSELNVGYNIKVLDVKNEWCEIQVNQWNVEVIGWVKYKYIAPVEIQFNKAANSISVKN